MVTVMLFRTVEHVFNVLVTKGTLKTCPTVAFAAICLVVVAPGCGAKGPPRVPALGEVAVDGTPLKAGTIRFVPTGETKGPLAVATIRDGHYEFPAAEGPVVGTHRVEIEAIDYYQFALDDEQAFAQHVEKKRRPMPPNPIHQNYNRRSVLTASVTPEGNRQLDFALRRDGRRQTPP